MEENAIVAEVGFMENAKGAAIAEGFSMGKDKGMYAVCSYSQRVSFGKSVTHALVIKLRVARVVRRAQGHRGKQLLGGQESRETTIANGKQDFENGFIMYAPGHWFFFCDDFRIQENSRYCLSISN